MRERDAILQINRGDARLLLKSLQSTQELLQITADMVPTAGEVVEDRLQQLSRLRALMLKVHNAPAVNNFFPTEVGGACLVRANDLLFESWNGALETLLGYTTDEAIGSEAWRLLGVAEHTAYQLAAKIKDEGELQFPLALRSKTSVTLQCMIFAQMIYTQCGDRHGSEHILVHFWLT